MKEVFVKDFFVISMFLVRQKVLFNGMGVISCIRGLHLYGLPVAPSLLPNDKIEIALKQVGWRLLFLNGATGKWQMI